jgi:hypothetical protein
MRSVILANPKTLIPRELEYKPEYCQKLIEHMSTGLSYESFGGVVDVGRQTMYDWEKRFPEWLHAKRVAFDKCQLWWEKTGLNGMFMSANSKDNPFQGAIWNFNMSARFKWSQKTESSVTVSRLEDLLSADTIEGEVVHTKIEHDEVEDIEPINVNTKVLNETSNS